MRWKKIAEPSRGTPRKSRLAPTRPAVPLAVLWALVRVSARMAAAAAKKQRAGEPGLPDAEDQERKEERGEGLDGDAGEVERRALVDGREEDVEADGAEEGAVEDEGAGEAAVGDGPARGIGHGGSSCSLHLPGLRSETWGTQILGGC